MPRNTPGGGPAPPPALKSKVARTGAPGVNKSPTKKKDAVKDIAKVASAAAEGGLDIKELEKRRKELADQLKKCETQASVRGTLRRHSRTLPWRLAHG